MPRRKFHRHRIFNFAVGKNTTEEFFTETIERMLNSRALHQIDADAKHTHVRGVIKLAGDCRAGAPPANFLQASDALALQLSGIAVLILGNQPSHPIVL